MTLAEFGFVFSVAAFVTSVVFASYNFYKDRYDTDLKLKKIKEELEKLNASLKD